MVKVGKGKKICPQCKNTLGARTLRCPTLECGYEFTKKTPSEKKGRITSEPEAESVNLAKILGFTGDIVLAPAGECPCGSPIGYNEESIHTWAYLVVMNGLARGMLYTVKALKQFLRQYVDFNSDQYTELCSMLDTWYYKLIER